jgi:hypothetical protein
MQVKAYIDLSICVFYSGSTIIFANASLGTTLQPNRPACEVPVVPRYRFGITTLNSSGHIS